eukprot:COSAG05_NODE_19760_length_288_cov_0.746032_1_plen_46_part_01
MDLHGKVHRWKKCEQINSRGDDGAAEADAAGPPPPPRSERSDQTDW